MREGQPVEVRTPWAAQGRGLPPLYHWFGGYEFVQKTPRGVLVRQVRGSFAGVESLYRESDVRPARLEENPKRPPREWWYRCVRGVESRGEAYNPQEVCGALWYRKMSATDKRRITREAESMKQNPDESDVLTTLIVGGAIAGGLWLLLRSKSAKASSALASPCANFDSLNGPLESFGKVKGYTVWAFPNKPFSAGWPAPKPAYTADPFAKAYSLADCSFYQWKQHEGAPDAWVKDNATNAEFDTWRKS